MHKCFVAGVISYIFIPEAIRITEKTIYILLFNIDIIEVYIVIKTCAEGIDLAQYGIQHNSCIDQERIEQIIGCKLEVKKDNQRTFCQCIECADIGQYNTCQHGCKYCYANFNSKMVMAAVESHDDNSPLLTGTVNENCKITNYAKAKSLKKKEPGRQNGQQMELF